MFEAINIVHDSGKQRLLIYIPAQWDLLEKRYSYKLFSFGVTLRFSMVAVLKYNDFWDLENFLEGRGIFSTIVAPPGGMKWIYFVEHIMELRKTDKAIGQPDPAVPVSSHLQSRELWPEKIKRHHSYQLGLAWPLSSCYLPFFIWSCDKIRNIYICHPTHSINWKLLQLCNIFSPNLGNVMKMTW